MRPVLVVIDPIGSYLGGGTDAHRDNEVRGVLAPLAMLAAEYNAAVVVVAHRRKSGGNSADDLVLGSRAFTGIARACHHLSRDPEQKDRRLLLPGKNNLAPEGDGLAFAIEGSPARLVWESAPVQLNADEGLAAEESIDREKPGPEPKAKNAAGEWLRQLLKNGSVTATKVREECKAAGLVYRTVQRAADEIGVVREPGFGGGWVWMLQTLPAHLDKHLDRGPLTHNNLSTCPDAKTPEKEEESLVSSRVDDKLFSLGDVRASAGDPSMRIPATAKGEQP